MKNILEKTIKKLIMFIVLFMLMFLLLFCLIVNIFSTKTAYEILTECINHSYFKTTTRTITEE